MANAVDPIPKGYHHLTPYLIVSNGARAIEYYKQVFGATELFRMDGPNGKIGHAELKVGDSPFMLADEHPDWGAKSPQSYGGSPISLLLYVEKVDEVVQRAVSAGSTLVKPVENQFYGDRSGTITDPFGHMWTVATHVEDVSPEEMEKRMAGMMEKSQGA